MGFFFIVVFTGVVFWVTRVSKRDQEREQANKAELERQEQLEKARIEEDIKQQKKLAEIESRHRERRKKDQQKRQYLKEKKEKLLKNNKQTMDQESIHFDFHFNYYYEEKLDSVMIVFDNQQNLQNYKTFIRDSMEYSQVLYQYIEENRESMKAQLGLSSAKVSVYLMLLYGNSEDMDDISKLILSKDYILLENTVIKLDKDGRLIDGEVFDILKPEEVMETPKMAIEVSEFMGKINYFILKGSIFAYFKNESLASLTLEKITESLRQTVHFCQIMQTVKVKIEYENKSDQLLKFFVMPGAAEDKEQAVLIMNRLRQDDQLELSKFLVVIDEQGNVSDGVLAQTLPVQMLPKKIDIQSKQAVLARSEVSDISNVHKNKPSDSNYNVYEWFIKKTGEIFYVGIGVDEKQMPDKTDLFTRVKDKYPSDYRYVSKQLTKLEAIEQKNEQIKKVLSAGNVLADIQVPVGYAGGYSSAEEKTSYGARKFYYLETPKISGNVVEKHYELLDSSESYDEVTLEDLKKTVMPVYSLNLVESLYFKQGSGNTDALVDQLKIEIQDRVGAKFYKSLAKSASSVILTNDPFPRRVKELHDKGYKVFHLVDVIKFLNINLEQVTDLIDSKNS